MVDEYDHDAYVVKYKSSEEAVKGIWQLDDNVIVVEQRELKEL